MVLVLRFKLLTHGRKINKKTEEALLSALAAKNWVILLKALGVVWVYKGDTSDERS